MARASLHRDLISTIDMQKTAIRNLREHNVLLKKENAELRHLLARHLSELVNKVKQPKIRRSRQ